MGIGEPSRTRVLAFDERLYPSRGMPEWRAKQRSLPALEKLQLIGRFIRETRELERIKQQCKKSVMS